MKEHSKQWTLGQLIDALERVGDKTNPVRFDFCRAAPTTLASYRGYYEDIALGWEDEERWPEPTVSDLLKVLNGRLSTVVHGYKGGQYIVSRDQIIYVANPGKTSSTGIVGLDSGYFTVIRTVCTELGES